MRLARGLPEGVVESRDPRVGKGTAEAPRWVRPNPGCAISVGPTREHGAQALSSARVGTPRGGTGVGMGCELRNEASEDLRMVTIPRAEEEPVQVAKLRTGAGAKYSSTPPTPGARGCRLGCRLRRRPHLRKHPWEGTSVSQGESHLNAWPSWDAHRDFSPSCWGAPVTASATHTHTPPPPRPSLILHTGPGMKILPLPKLLEL